MQKGSNNENSHYTAGSLNVTNANTHVHLDDENNLPTRAHTGPSAAVGNHNSL